MEGGLADKNESLSTDSLPQENSEKSTDTPPVSATTVEHNVSSLEMTTNELSTPDSSHSSSNINSPLTVSVPLAAAVTAPNLTVSLPIAPVTVSNQTPPTPLTVASGISASRLTDSSCIATPSQLTTSSTGVAASPLSSVTIATVASPLTVTPVPSTSSISSTTGTVSAPQASGSSVASSSSIESLQVTTQSSVTAVPSNSAVSMATSTSTGQTSETGSTGMEVRPSQLSKVDLQLLALLQANLPHLSHVQESIKSIIQNNLILQSMKSSLLTGSSSATIPSITSTSSSTATPSSSSAVMSSSAAAPITSVGVTGTPTQLTTQQRKPVLAQVIGTSGSAHVGTTPVKAVAVVRKTPPIQVVHPPKVVTPPKVTASATPTPNKVTGTLAATGKGVGLTTPKSRLPSILRRGDLVTPTSSPLAALAAKISAENSSNQSRKPVKPEPDEAEDAEESMEIDVGQTVVPLDPPPHLIDHDYCLYNPTVSLGPRPPPDHLITIPSERLSYAPEIPDSPRTLYKLLKVLPRKGTSSAQRSRTSVSKSLTPYGKGMRKPFSRSGGSSKRKSSHYRRGSTRATGGAGSANALDSEEEESFGTPDVSDGEAEDPSKRRRSQRNKGQRKHYVDDINISLSDEETLDDIMQPPPKKTGYYGIAGPEDEESDYDEMGGSTPLSGGGARIPRYKKAVTITPTEGFRYSDIYMDAPAEEAQIVEKILSHRVRPVEVRDGEKPDESLVEEYLVKYKNYSYIHAEWATADKLLRGDKRFDGKVKRYKAKQACLGIFANVDDEPFNPDYTVADRVLDIATQVESSGEKVTHYLVKWKSLPYEDSTWELEEDVDRETVRKFLDYSTMPPDEELQYTRRPPPNRFKPIKEMTVYKGDNYLRPYQLEGLNWLLFNWYTRQNCIMADEMGLGKTVQSIALLLEIVKSGIRGPFLVIAPLSTISNWQREFETWSDLNVIIYHGSAYSRRMIQEYELYFRDESGKIIIDAYKFNIIVTTYEVMLSDNSELQNILWRAVVIDEAHRLKNKNCKMLEGLRELHMEHRVLLTGTPLQNSVDELFSLLNFLEPSQFPSLQLFLQQFGNLKTEEQVDELKAVLKPMMLRRLKEDVEKSLAPKEETIVEIELTAIQKQYYRAILERNFSFLTKGNTVPNLLNTMMELRKCCNHPFLIAGAELKIVEDFRVRYPNRPVSDSLIQASGKLVLVDKLLPKLREKGHKVLIFSQMVKCLDILEDYLRMNGYLYERIDGQVRGTLRQSAIDRFSKPEYDRFVFLLCTRAGGLGINLTAADTVIIYDSDWNPQNDIQAQARCHRIGQNKMVKVYRLITTNSYEREMFDRASLKLGLDKAVLQSMNTQSTNTPTAANNGPPQLSKTEIENLLKKGAYGSIMDNDEAANQFCEEDIEQILERRTHVIQLESEGKGSTFSKASFVADGSTDIDIDDPDFWQKWAQKANLNLDQLAKKDALVMDEPRVRKQVRRYGDELLETIVDMDESQEEILDILPSRGKKGWTKLECFKTEKALLVYGWGQWEDILNACRFRKRQLNTRDVENISRTMLLYCLHHFTGDEKIKLYVHQLIDPSETTEDNGTDEGKRTGGYFYGFTEEDYLALMAKDPESLFQEESYMKHLRRHATRILLRVRQLHIIRWQIMKPYIERIMGGALAKELGFVPPKPEEDPPVLWWTDLCDTSLLVAIIKHGYEQFSLWRSDRSLCFWELVGEQLPQVQSATTSSGSSGGNKSSKKKKRSSKATPTSDSFLDVESEGEEELLDFEEELDDNGDESDDGTSSSVATPPVPKLKTIFRKTRASTAAMLVVPTVQLSSSVQQQQQYYTWPSLADINTRARRLVNAYLKQQKREELRQAQLLKEQERKVREAEVSRKRELKKAELAQKWSKREEQDFIRVVSFFGIEYEDGSNKYDWTRFRQLANLGKKSDDRLTLYFHDFKEMCRRVIKKRRPKLGYSGVLMDPVSEERAIKCLQRIDLLTAVRRELLPHPHFNELINLCQSSFEVPHWWLPGQHDRDLLRGVAKHGLYRTDYLLYNDSELSFLTSVPQSALFTPNYPNKEDNDEDEGSEGSEEEIEGQKMKSTSTTTNAPTPVPLGWPKEKAVVIRISRIIFAFRNKIWPKPMEGLDLFNPVPALTEEESSPSPTPSPRQVVTAVSDDGESDRGSDEDYILESGRGSLVKKPSNITMKIGKSTSDGPLTVTLAPYMGNVDSPVRLIVNENTSASPNFQVEKQHGLKMTLKKGSMIPSSTDSQMQMNVKIPLLSLQFPSAKGLARIPKKRPASERDDVDISKSHKSKMLIVDPGSVNIDKLTGSERVGVLNMETGEKLAINHSPTLKKLKEWLATHPQYCVDENWNSIVTGWNFRLGGSINSNSNYSNSEQTD